MGVLRVEDGGQPPHRSTTSVPAASSSITTSRSIGSRGAKVDVGRHASRSETAPSRTSFFKSRFHGEGSVFGGVFGRRYRAEIAVFVMLVTIFFLIILLSISYFVFADTITSTNPSFLWFPVSNSDSYLLNLSNSHQTAGLESDEYDAELEEGFLSLSSTSDTNHSIKLNPSTATNSSNDLQTQNRNPSSLPLPLPPPRKKGGHKNKKPRQYAPPPPPWYPDHFLEDSASASSRKLLSPGCNLWEGRWIYDTSYPLWDADSCSIASHGVNCPRRGRKNLDYLNFRWQPHGCNIPRFDGDDFRARMRNKRLAFVGDSLGRNQFESLLCLLQQGLPKGDVYEKFGNQISKRAGFLIFVFSTHNFTVEYYRSPFLVSTGRLKNKSVLRLNSLDESWKSKVEDADFVIFNAGHWFSPHKTTDSGIGFELNGELIDIHVDDAFKTVLETLAAWSESVVVNKPRVIYRGLSPVHYRQGSWYNGGKCPDLHPLWNASSTSKVSLLRNITVSVVSRMKKPFLFLDIERLSLLRSDGHIARTNRTENDRRSDCSHWCLPGVPDVWNELLYSSLLLENKPPFLL